MGYLLLGDAWSKLYGGLQGNGKSYSAVLQMAAVAAAGGHISSNVELVKEGFEELCLKRHGVKIKFEEQYKFLTDEEIPNFHAHTPSGTDDSPNMVVIDECDLFWFKSDSAETKKKCRDLIKFLKLCRQENTLVIFMTQKKDLLDKSLRDLCENWDFRDMAKYRFLGWKPLSGWLVSIQRAPSGNAKLGNAKWAKKDLNVFKAYNSRQFKGRVKRSGEVGKVELERVANGAGIRNFLSRFWLPLAFLFGVWYFWSSPSIGEQIAGSTKPFPGPNPRMAPPMEPLPARVLVPAAATAAEPPQRRFTGPDGVEYFRPPENVIVVRHLEYGATKIRVTLASPPYPRAEQFYVGDYSSVLGKIIVSTGIDKGRRWVMFDDGSSAYVVTGRSHFGAPRGHGAGNLSGPAGTNGQAAQQGIN